METRPKVVDAVIMYAQRGHGKRSSYYSDFTFGVWRDDILVPIGKAYSGFTDVELGRLDKFVRSNTVARSGPVREVAKTLVVEVAFDSPTPARVTNPASPCVFRASRAASAGINRRARLRAWRRSRRSCWRPRVGASRRRPAAARSRKSRARWASARRWRARRCVLGGGDRRQHHSRR